MLGAGLKLSSVLSTVNCSLTLVGGLKFCCSFYIGIYIDSRIKIIYWVELEPGHAHFEL